MSTQADDCGEARRPDPWDDRFDQLFSFREHDYDPRWHYSEQLRLDLLEDPRYREAEAELKRLARDPRTPFVSGRIFPADLLESFGAVAIYCAGTYNEPVILLDLDAHEGDLWQLKAKRQARGRARDAGVRVDRRGRVARRGGSRGARALGAGKRR